MSTGTKPGRKKQWSTPLSLPLFSSFEPSQAVTEIEITWNTDRHREKRQRNIWQWIKIDCHWPFLSASLWRRQVWFPPPVWLEPSVTVRRLTPLLWCGDQMDIYERWRLEQAEVFSLWVCVVFCHIRYKKRFSFVKTKYHIRIIHPDMAAQLILASSLAK